MQRPIRYKRPVWLFTLVISACQSQPALVFTGEIKGLVRDSIYLFKWEAGRWDRVLGAKVSDGKFSFRGTPTPGIYLWGLSPQEGDIISLNGKDQPHIKGDVNQLLQTYIYEKSPENEALLNFRREINKLYQQIGQLPPEQRANLQQQVDNLTKQAEKSPYATVRLYGQLFRSPKSITPSTSPHTTWSELVKSFWEGISLDNPLVTQIPETFMRLQGFWQNALALLPEDSLHVYVEVWAQKTPPAFQSNIWITLLDVAQRFQLVETMLFAAEKFVKAAPFDPRRAQIEQFIQAEGTLRRGRPAPDIALPDPDGKTRRLSELRGKWVLIDFWASWCRPCRIENPNVVRLYQKYHPKGFDIFGVSLDSNKDAWIQAIKSDNLSWTHVSDLRGWQSAGAQLYRVSGIPFTVLVDPEGKIVAKGLRGPSLEAKLREIFGE
ncbi:MAG: AhpC/TSA family protein [Bacteroidia bacterium]|nr:AhpC/TSA family protein [Bacteroidia bacterium]MCX7651938.1 AhpC/TSA family protein [Bacteroidia bacterium]MDW8416089.1 TlpA disulfide reductase family protein [Bacteroidia bacterium]